MELIRETNLYDNDAIANMRTALDNKFSSTYGTCSTGASTVAKVVTLANFTLFKGAQISVFFTYANTATAPTLNVNGTGAKAIWARGAAIASQYYWSARSLQKFVYDGANWVMDAESQEETFDRLTNDGAIKGIFMNNGQMYINMDYLQTGILKLGGSGANATNGLMIIYNSSGTEIGRWDKNGISVKAGSITGGTINGASITLGGSNNTSGTITVKDANGNTIGTWNKDGLTASGLLTMQYSSTSGSTTTTGTCLTGYAKIFSDRGSIISPSFVANSHLGFVLKAENSNSLLHYYKGIEMGSAFTSDTTLAYGTTTRSVIVTGTSSSTSSTGGWKNSILNMTSASTLQSYAESNAYVRLEECIYPNSGGTGNATWRLTGRSGSSEVMNSYLQLSGHGHAVFGDTIDIGVSSTYYIQLNSTHAWAIKDTRGSGYISIASSSSKRYKHAISAEIDKRLDPKKLYKLPMKQFIFNDDHPLQYEDMRGQTIGGFIAEDVDKIYPSAVIHNGKGEIESWDERRIIPAMLKLIQEQHDEIEKLKQVIHVA